LTTGTAEAVRVGNGRKTVGSRDGRPASRGSSEDVGTESEPKKQGLG